MVEGGDGHTRRSGERFKLAVLKERELTADKPFFSSPGEVTVINFYWNQFWEVVCFFF